MQEPSNKADWLAIVLQFVFGLLAGGLIGLAMVKRRYRYEPWLREDLLWPYLIGCALFTAGLCAKFGDRLWLSDSYRMIRPEGPGHSRGSLWLPYGAMLIGAALVISSLYRHFL